MPKCAFPDSFAARRSPVTQLGQWDGRSLGGSEKNFSSFTKTEAGELPCLPLWFWMRGCEDSLMSSCHSEKPAGGQEVCWKGKNRTLLSCCTTTWTVYPQTPSEFDISKWLFALSCFYTDILQLAEKAFLMLQAVVGLVEDMETCKTSSFSSESLQSKWGSRHMYGVQHLSKLNNLEYDRGLNSK